MAVVLAACGGASEPAPTAAREVPDSGTPPRQSACAHDTQCPKGMLCEACADGFQTCVPGCREDSQCGPSQICNHAITCVTCPCPSGLCDLDPCRDADGDGFAPLGPTSCPGRQLGDCDDGQPSVHPGALERCANGLDDDCDGKRDTNDDGCRVCTSGQSYCASTLSCGASRYCEQGCCESCPVVAPPSCGSGQCVLNGGVDARGCVEGAVCGDCLACPQHFEPVCGRNFSTYTNACHAQAAGTTVMHTGQCARGEGLACAGPEDCPYSPHYCRDFGGGERRCARVGTCGTDADCAHVQATVSCGDAGTASYACRDERCAPVCP